MEISQVTAEQVMGALGILGLGILAMTRIIPFVKNIFNGKTTGGCPDPQCQSDMRRMMESLKDFRKASSEDRKDLHRDIHAIGEKVEFIRGYVQKRINGGL